MDNTTKKALLSWQYEMGASDAVEETPQNRLVQKSEVRGQRSGIIEEGPVEVRMARAAANNVSTLEELKNTIKGFDDCGLKKTATNTVFADGNPESKIMLVGEAPGENEDLQGIPFCGASGKLLDATIASIGLNRTNVYITNTIFWRPPGNRRPTPEEIAICRPFVEKHIALVAPKLIVLVGGTATEALLNITSGVTKLRGKQYEYMNQYLSKSIPAMVTYHPSYLLRQPTQKRQAWQDMLAIKYFLREKNISI